MALDIVLFVDEADRLPESTRVALAYLLRNAPPNLRVVVAARADAGWGSTISWLMEIASSWGHRGCVSGSTRRSN
jgi:ATP/maltotriose-dependent transcriptional regulator MalT